MLSMLRPSSSVDSGDDELPWHGYMDSVAHDGLAILRRRWLGSAASVLVLVLAAAGVATLVAAHPARLPTLFHNSGHLDQKVESKEQLICTWISPGTLDCGGMRFLLQELAQAAQDAAVKHAKEEAASAGCAGAAAANDEKKRGMMSRVPVAEPKSGDGAVVDEKEAAKNDEKRWTRMAKAVNGQKLGGENSSEASPGDDSQDGVGSGAYRGSLVEDGVKAPDAGVDEEQNTEEEVEEEVEEYIEEEEEEEAEDARVESRRGKESTSTTTRTTTPQNVSAIKLLCFAVMRTDHTEISLLRSQLEKGASIFACNSWKVFSDVKTWLSPGPPVRIETVALPDGVASAGSPAMPSQKANFFNTDVFMHAWDMIRNVGQYQSFDWVVKVDPDTIFFPDRLRERLRGGDAEGGTYFKNCHLGDKDRLFGSIEVVSKRALDVYFKGNARCTQELQISTMPEDAFMSSCLDLLGVRSKTDLELLSDAFCEGTISPCVSGRVAFHPARIVPAYFQCMREAQDSAQNTIVG